MVKKVLCFKLYQYLSKHFVSFTDYLVMKPSYFFPPSSLLLYVGGIIYIGVKSYLQTYF